MGLFRTLLALSVVLEHAAPDEHFLVGGRIAVQCFYILSGFLISYVLVERRSYTSALTFYVNRYLRLYPIYFVLAILSLTAILTTHLTGFESVYSTAPPAAVALLIFANVLIVGQDWVMFSGVTGGKLAFSVDFSHSDIPLYQGLVIRPAWTLGVELTFYLLAPFLLPRRHLMWFLLAASVTLRVIFLGWGFGGRDPWTYRFFPTELALFLAGALSHQILLPAYRKIRPRRQILAAKIATGFLIAVCALYGALRFDAVYKMLLLYSAVGCLVPLTFLFAQQHRFDGWVGELSYPIYICHALVMWICVFLLKHFRIQDELITGATCVTLSVLFAIGLNRLVAQPFEAVRNRLRSKGIARGSHVGDVRASIDATEIQIRPTAMPR